MLTLTVLLFFSVAFNSFLTYKLFYLDTEVTDLSNRLDVVETLYVDKVL